MDCIRPSSALRAPSPGGEGEQRYTASDSEVKVKSRSFIGRLDQLIFGIRDGKQIAFRDFGDMYIPAPPVAEQEAHARALGSLEADLALEDERIAALTRQKRGLMQKLLTGEWRVSP